jgi:ElaB/YqjD/DUF883 family membrane-anchored ribosome-binding protein
MLAAGTHLAPVNDANPSFEQEINMQSTVGSSTSMTGSNVRESASNMSDKAHSSIDRFSASAHNTVDKMVSAASSAAERLNVADTKFAHTANEWKEQTCSYVRAHPMTAVGIAVAAGYLLSRLTHFR